MKKGWEAKRLGDVVSFQRGLTYSKKDEVDFSSNIVLRANNVDLRTNALDFSELKYINDDLTIPKEKKVTKGSLIICTASGSKSHLGKIALIDDDYDYAFGGFMGQLNPSNNIDSKYLFHLLTSDAYKTFINKLSDGVNINNLRFDDLSAFPVPLPSLPEQKRIVDILDKAFAAISTAKENAEKNIANARELFESYLQSVFANPGDGWERKELKEVGTTQTGTTPKTSDRENYGQFIPFIKPADININGDGEIRYDNDGLSEAGLNNGRTILKDSVLMVCIGASIGKVGFTDRQVSCNQQINTLTVRKGLMGKFFYYALSTKAFFQEVIKNSAQATLPIINKSKWESLLVQFPESLPEQRSIVAKLDALSAERKKLETIYRQKLAGLDELKKSILQKAFAGELPEVKT